MIHMAERIPEEETEIVDFESGVSAGGQDEGVQEKIHRVPLPQKRRTMRGLLKWSAECFFPDEPLHNARKGKGVTKRMLLLLQFIFPVLTWAPLYRLELLKSDALAGLTIASLAIPQGISYAQIANLPPLTGLYSSFVPPLIYLILGSSNELAVGPSSIVSVVLGSMLSAEVSPLEKPDLYLQLALTATFFSGALQASLGLLRLGFILEFLSKPTLAGFTSAAAIITMLQQLKGLTGITHFTKKTSSLSMILSGLKHRSEWNLKTISMGFAFLTFLLLAKYFSKKKPKLYLISAIAPLFSVILSTIIIYAFRSTDHGIKTVGHLKRGLNSPSLDKITFQSTYMTVVLKTGIICGIISLTEGIAVGRTLASLKDYQIEGNKEMTAFGIMNIAGSLTSCFITTGSFSRSAVNYSTGSKTAVSNLVMALVVLIILLFLMPLFYYTPNVVLSVIIITASIGLIDYKVPIQLWNVDKIDFVAYLGAFFGVLFISIPIGIAISVVISVAKLLLPVTRPNIAIMGRVVGTQSFRSLEQYRDAIRVPHVVILSIEFPIFFAGAVYIQDRILRWVREEEERAAKINENGIKYVVLDMSAVTTIDIGGIDALLEARKSLDKRSLQLVLANPIGEVANKLYFSEAWKEFGNNIFMNVAEAVSAVTKSDKSQT